MRHKRDDAQKQQPIAVAKTTKREWVRVAILTVLVLLALPPAMLVGGCVCRSTFVPEPMTDASQSIGSSRWELTLGGGSPAPEGVSPHVDADKWKDTLEEAVASNEGNDSPVMVLENYPGVRIPLFRNYPAEMGEALVLLPFGSSHCPAVHMVSYIRQYGKYGVYGTSGGSVARPSGRLTPIGPWHVYSTTENVADSIASCAALDVPIVFGVSLDPAVKNLTIGGQPPAWVREVSYNGGTCYVWCYEGMDVYSEFKAAGLDTNNFTYRQVIDGLDIRVGDEEPYSASMLSK